MPGLFFVCLFFVPCHQVVEFNFLKAQAQEPLSTFLEYITYEYMIENIMMLLKGTLSGRDVNELIEQCHPMVRPRMLRREGVTLGASCTHGCPAVAANLGAETIYLVFLSLVLFFVASFVFRFRYCFWG